MRLRGRLGVVSELRGCRLLALLGSAAALGLRWAQLPPFG